MGGGLFKESISKLLGDAFGTAAVRCRTDTSDDIRNGLCQRFVFGRAGRHHAISVETGGGENFIGICRILGSDGVGRLFVQVVQNAAGRLQQLPANFTLIINRSQRQAGAPRQQFIGGFQRRTGPAHGCQQLRCTDASIPIGVEQLQGVAVKLNP